MIGTAAWPVRTLVAGLAGALATTMLLFVGDGLTRNRRLEMSGDRFLVRPLARGVYEAETSPDGMSYAWTADVMTLGLPGIDRTTEWTMTLRGRSAAVDPAVPVTALVDGVVVRRWPADGQLATLTFDLPASPRSGAVITVTAPAASGGPADPRVLGLLLDSMTLSRARRFVWPPNPALRAAATIGFAAGAGLALIEVPAAAGLALLFVVAGGHAWLLSIGFAPFDTVYLDRIGSVAAAVLAAAAVARWVALQGGASVEARVLAGIVLIATATKALILTHPAVFPGDIGFHVHRLQAVGNGEWLFTSLGPGGEFPYPVALYAVASALHALTPNSDLLLRMLVLGTDAAAAVLTYVVGSRAWGDRRAALLAAVLLATAKATFHTQVVAFLTNGFGESLATVALLALAGTTLPIAIAVALTASASLVAMLSHVSTALLLGSSLAAAAVAECYRATRAMRRTGLVAVAALALSATAAYEIYYRHFTRLYHLDNPVSTRPAAGSAVPTQRIEAHQTAWAPGAAAMRARAGAVPRYTQRYYGWAPILLAAMGIPFLARRADALSRVILARLGVCGAFLAIGITTPLDLRYYLGGAGAIALAGGFGAARGLSSSNRLLAAICRALLAWCIAENLRYWFGWFT